MNFKLLEKLVRLANNNPNEHEANSAARRVCRMIAEANFKFTEDETPVGIYGSSTGRNVSTADIFNDLINKMRREENGAKYDAPWTRPFREGSWKARDVRPPKSEPPPEESPFKKGYYSGIDWDIPNYKNREPKPKRTLNCKTCKLPKETSFVGQPELFECNDCQWTAYLRST